MDVLKASGSMKSCSLIESLIGKVKGREYFNERGLIAYLRNEWNIAIEYFRRGSKDNMNESGPSLAKAFETVKDDLNNN